MPAARRLAAVALLVVVSPLAPAADPAAVKTAIARGGAFLRGKLAAVPIEDSQEAAGVTPLAALAALEAGVPAADPGVQAAAKYVRDRAFTETQTYHVALDVLFLDRLGDPADAPVIQFLGARLTANLFSSGSWGYVLGESLGEAEQTRLRAAFRTVPPAGGLHPEVARYLAAVRVRPEGDGDGSNTQFGLVGLWVAARRGVPADDAFALVLRRALATQQRDGGWGYRPEELSSPTMTCAGLLGLAVGAAAGQRRQLQAGPEKEKKPVSGDPFFNPPKASAPDRPPPPPAVPLPVAAGLAYLGRAINATRAARPTDFARLPVGGNLYYSLWSIERVAVAYNLDTLGDVDWHDWGATGLLALQQEGGGWPEDQYGSTVNTAFAVLFLARANFTRDLTRNLSGQVKDPGKAELRGSVGGTPPVAVTPTPPTSPADPPMAVPDDGVAAGLVAAGADWSAVLAAARDAKGSEHTAGLVRAIPKLDGDRQKQAREALAERLTRMTAATLRTMLADPDAELRRAACLACAMKDDPAHVADLIGRVDDPSDPVVRAARAGLRSLTGEDFGPPPGADAAAKRKAKADWQLWAATRPMK